MAEAELMTPKATLWSEINEAHSLTERSSANARRAAGEAIQHAITCGGLLEQAKAQVKHGEWAAERDQHFEGSDRTARLYQQLFNGRHYLESATVADLTLNGAAKLVSKAQKEAKRTEANQETAEQEKAAAQECVNPTDLGTSDTPREPVEPDARRKVAQIAQRLVDAQAIVGAAVAGVEALEAAAEGTEQAWLAGLLVSLTKANDGLIDFVELGLSGGQ